MDRRLLAFKASSMVFSIIVIIIFLLAVYSSFINPMIEGEMFVVLPSEEDIDWRFEEESLIVESELEMKNTGYFDLQDIDIRIDLLRLDNGEDVETFYSDTIFIESLEVGESRTESITLNLSTEDFSEEEMEEFIFESLEFQVSSEMSARYPFSLMHLDLVYHEIIEWDGVVQELEFHHEEASVHTFGNDEGSVLELPFVVETNDLLSGTSNVDIYMEDKDGDLYSTYSLDIPLGTRVQEDLRFQLDEEGTREFITRSQRLDFVSDIELGEEGLTFEHTTSHDWGAPLNELEIEVSRDGNKVNTSYSFENDSPRTLILFPEIEVFDSDGNLIGSDETAHYVQSGVSIDDMISIEVEGEPAYIEVYFYEDDTEMEHREEVWIDE